MIKVYINNKEIKKELEKENNNYMFENLVLRKRLKKAISFINDMYYSSDHYFKDYNLLYLKEILEGEENEVDTHYII